MAGNIGDYFTVLSNLSIQTPNSGSTATVALNGAVLLGPSHLSMPSAASIQCSTGTVVWGAVQMSWRTISTAASMSSIAPSNADNGVLAIAFAASGISLLYRSGNSVYIVGQSATSAAAP